MLSAYEAAASEGPNEGRLIIRSRHSSVGQVNLTDFVRQKGHQLIQRWTNA